MNFDFIPYRLNADIGYFKGNIQYISSDNGVDLYRAKDGFMKLLLGFTVTVANLYFFEGSLITVYIRLTEHGQSINEVKRAMEGAILMDAKTLFTDTGLMYYWQDNKQLLGLISQGTEGDILMYHSLNKFNVFIQ